MRANQLRLWFASFAYVLLCALRRIGLAQTQFARASCGTIRLKLLKIGALVRISVRRVVFAMASGCPWREGVHPRSPAIAECHCLTRNGYRMVNNPLDLAAIARHYPKRGQRSARAQPTPSLIPSRSARRKPTGAPRQCEKCGLALHEFRRET